LTVIIDWIKLRGNATGEVQLGVTCGTRRWTNEEGNEQRLGVLHVEVEEAHHGAADVDAPGELRDLAEVVVAVRRCHELALAARLKRK
jgi:hypothetical protein